MEKTAFEAIAYRRSVRKYKNEEIDTDKVAKLHGMDITFVTSAETDEEAFALLKYFGMPFKRRN